MNLIIDGDGFVYRCGFAVEKTKYLVESWTDSVATFQRYDNHKEAKQSTLGFEDCSTIWSRKDLEPVENALALVRGAIDSLPEGTREVWLSGVGNFRDSIATIAKYKGNRDAAARPTYYKEIIQYLKDKYQANSTSGEEADDRLGIRAGEDPNSVVVSFDKDLDQIPGKHYNWVTKEAYEVSPKLAAMNFYCQVLSGDRVDNVPGLEGIGEVKSRRMLEGVASPREAWKRVLEAYTGPYGVVEGYRRAVETARLVYVRRKDGEIWEPPV